MSSAETNAGDLDESGSSSSYVETSAMTTIERRCLADEGNGKG